MTLAAQITADVTSVFLETDDFATTITHYPAGDYTAGVSVDAIVDKAMLDAASGGDGEGVDIGNDKGVRIRQTAEIEVPTSVTVTEKRGKLKPSIWLIDSVRWMTIRIVGTDDDMQTVLIARVEKKMTRRTQPVQ